MTDVRFEIRGRLGLITLDRPDALNALTHAMALEIETRLDAWAADPAVTVVAIAGEGERAFCAGGDIRALWEAGRPGGERGRANWPFYADEYRLNAKIHRFPKPYVAVMDGIVMGGGVGVSVHGSHRIATERTVFAMPETGIGLFPDVGGTWFLPRLPGGTGMWLALTGARLKGDEAVQAGVCDWHLASDRIDSLLHALETVEVEGREPQEAVDWIVEAHARRPDGPTAVEDRRALIDRHFAGDSLAAILAGLAADEHDWAGEQHAAILQKSPTCTAIAFRQMREGARLASFADAMRLEYRLARYCMTHPDFYEGVRAAIIDRDSPPRWQPATLAEVDPAEIDRAFAPLPEGEELRL